MRFGPLVYTLSVSHPLRILEEICMLDQMSNGRLELGVGRGVSPYEVGYFGVDPQGSSKIYTEAYLPYSNSQMSFQDAYKKAEAPLKAFMLKQTRENDMALFAKLGNRPVAEKPEAMPLTVVTPAFITSELKTAFQIAFMIFIPFLVIDMVVASVLMSMGMMMLSPAMISLPFKLILFVLVDGWNLLIGSLVASFHV